MYAVVKAGGQQFKVAENEVLSINKIEGDPGTKVTLDVLMLGGDKEPKIGTPIIPGAKVEGEIVRQKLGRKIHGFNFKAKKNVRRRWGHRSHLTEIRITKISAGK